MARVNTVLGPVDAADLGTTLMHEHLMVDATPWFEEPEEASRRAFSHRPVSMDMLGALKNEPFLCRDNCRLLDEGAAVEEVSRFQMAGGGTVVDPTCRGIGRDPEALKRISRATGLHVLMGAGYYLEQSHPKWVASMSAGDVADEIERDVVEGVRGVKAGIIGEIGVSAGFTPEEEKVLRGAARAQGLTGAPLEVHLPGWERLAGRVLDIVEEEGGDLTSTILCHMNPSGGDPGYQKELASRGAWLEYDMLGMDFFYADQQAQSPSDGENARALAGLKKAGFLGSVLLSGDVFLKIQLIRYGGTGYAHVLDNFVPRLGRHGFSDEDIDALIIENPKRALTGGR